MALIMIVFTGGCKTVILMLQKKPPEKINEAYREDLSVNRPKINYVQKDTIEEPMESGQPVDFQHHINDDLHVVLDSIASLRLEKNRINGFSIQLYNGTNHNVARGHMGFIIQEFPNEYHYMDFQQPFFRVTIGKFFHQLNAHRLLTDIKYKYPDASIVPATFSIIVETKD